MYPDFVQTCGLGSVTGIGGANCRHSYWPFIEGVMERTYTDEELKNIDPPPFEFEGKTYTMYEATQKQRMIERTIRKLKRERAAYRAAGLSEEAQAVSVRIRRLDGEYQAFSKAAGLPQQRERMNVLYESGIKGTSRAKLLPAEKNESIDSDVTAEYTAGAFPGKGKIIYENGYRSSNHQAEIQMAEWLHRSFGGDITLLREAETDSVKRPDYLWKNAFWELKSTTSVNGADKSLQHAIKQIHENPGGVILDLNNDIDTVSVENQMVRRVQRSSIQEFDLMLLKKGELIKIIRYKK